MKLLDCPRCGEHERINEYADMRPNGVNLYLRCMACGADFGGHFIEYKNASDYNPFINNKKQKEEN